MAVIFGSCAQKTMDKRSFVLSESVSLAQDMHNKGSLLFPQLDPSTVPAYWESLKDTDMSAPDRAVIVTIDSEFVIDILELFEYIELSDPSDELIELLAPMAISDLSSMVYAIIIDQGYSYIKIRTPFYATHIKETPEDFHNSLVFMDFNKCTAITSFTQQDDYVSCTCSFIIPDMTAEELLDIYGDTLKNDYGNIIFTGHTEIIDSAKLAEIVGG